MLLFGHVGITLGAAALATRTVTLRRPAGPLKQPFFMPLMHYLDIRVLIIGSMLPDIIDKPVGQIFFRNTFSNGRIFAHTLLFLVLLTAGGCLLYRRGRHLWLLTLAAGTFSHLAFDEMWQVPGTLFWPLMGLHFPQYEVLDWATHLLQALLSSPYIYVSEALGLVITIWFVVWVISRKKAGAFLRYGKFD